MKQSGSFPRWYRGWAEAVYPTATWSGSTFPEDACIFCFMAFLYFHHSLIRMSLILMYFFWKLAYFKFQFKSCCFLEAFLVFPIELEKKKIKPKTLKSRMVNNHLWYEPYSFLSLCYSHVNVIAALIDVSLEAKGCVLFISIISLNTHTSPCHGKRSGNIWRVSEHLEQRWTWACI